MEGKKFMLMIDPLMVIIIYVLAGFTLKLTDFYGEHRTGYLPYLITLLSASLFTLLISESEYSSAIAIGIIVGVLLSGKINRPNLIFGLLLIISLSLLLGFVIPNQIVFLISVFAFIDEVFHEKFKNRSKILRTFFQFRPVLKISIALFFLLKWLPLTHLIGFFCFDLSYDLTSTVLLKEKN